MVIKFPLTQRILVLYCNFNDRWNYPRPLQLRLPAARQAQGLSAEKPVEAHFDHCGYLSAVRRLPSWCRPCIEEIPDLNRIVEDYRNQKVRFIAFSDEHPDRLGIFNFNNYKKKRPDLQVRTGFRQP